MSDLIVIVYPTESKAEEVRQTLLVIGVLFLNPLVGAAIGATSGAIGGALSDVGINDAFVKDLSTSIEPRSRALFLLVQDMTTDKVLKQIRGFGGAVLKTSEPPRLCRRPQLVRSRVYDKQDDEQVLP